RCSLLFSARRPAQWGDVARTIRESSPWTIGLWLGRCPMHRPKLACAISMSFLVLASGGPLPAGEGLPRAQPDPVRLDAAKLERAGARFREAVDQKQIAGAVLLVARQGKIAYLDAVGMQDVESGVAMTPGTIFRIASMTKPVTSTAVMMLADQGRLDLSDP